ncbi:DUF1778 domain-containing protein [Vibrio sp. JC009]|uniref:type II toxin -antitoxin system TacA 1-like antitoxin n=1 Tax=Vibrio sp. JC009 TaxID=2912314 RepID=UPI0023B047D1|nr:DUF1778 domain-containing protein [Vibrio sp. JC009]WED23431.1 DUF1778 domain-containing protein [Vibrio sp. JC009]
MSSFIKERVEFRLSTKEKLALEETAILSNTTVSMFVLESVMYALENPPEPNEIMREIINMSLEETWTVKTKK